MAIFYTDSASLNSLQVTGSTILSVTSGTALQINGNGTTILSVDNNKNVNVSGSLIVTGSITGSLLGTASYAIQAGNASTASFVQIAETASYVLQAVSSSYATSASYLISGATASYAISASQAINATTASYVLQAVSASFATSASQAQNAVTASYADNFTVAGTLTAQTIIVQTITSSTDFVTGSTRFGSSLSNTHQFTGSVSITGSLTVANGVNNLTASNAVSASQAQNAVTASYALDATSASYAATASSADIFNVRTALTASGLNYPTTDGAYEFQVLQTDAAGTLSFGDVTTIYETIYNGEATTLLKGTPVYVSGSQGASPIVYRADASNPAKMPVIYIVSENIATASTGRGIVLGLITGIDLTGYEAGQEVYVASGGGWTITRPTGSVTIQLLGIISKPGNGGQGLVLNPGPAELPNLAPGYVWIGNSNSYPIATSTSSIQNVVSSSYALSASYALNADLLDGKDSSTFATTGSNIFVGNQTVTGSLFTTGSNTLIGSTTLTGSLNITGSTTQTGNNTLIGNTVLSGSIVISGSSGPGATTASVQIYGDIRQSGYHRFDPVTTNIDTSISASYIYVSGSTNDLYFSQNSKGYSNVTRLRWLEGNLYTGLLHGGVISAVTGSTTYTISSGSGIIVNLNASLSDDPYPSIQYLNWPNLSASIAPLTASYQQAFVGIDSTNNIYQQGTPFSNGQFDTIINIGNVLFQNGSTINGVKTQPSTAYGFEQAQNVFNRAFGPLKLSGFTLAPSGSSTGSLIVGSGTAYSPGSNYVIDPNEPYYTVDNGTQTSKIFRYYQSGSSWVYLTNAGAGFTTIDPSQYSNNGILTSIPSPGSNWSIQRVFWFPNSVTKAIVVYYGNAYYGTEADAIANLNIETFVEAPNTAANAIYLGAIVIRGSGVFTNANDFTILPGGLFRQVGGSGGGGSVITQTLSGLSDVLISGPTNGQALVYDTTAAKWENKSFINASISGNAATATTASFAQTASYVQTAQTASYVLNAISASYALSASQAEKAVTASYADNFTVAGTLTAQTIVAQTITSSTEFITGSTRFGSLLTNTHQFTGSVSITGSLSVANGVNNLTSSNAVSASYAVSASQSQTATTASFITLAQSASYVLQAVSASFATQAANATTASFVTLAQTASYVLQAVSASFATQAANATTASFVQNAQSASYVLNAVSASFAQNAATASFATNFTASNILVTGNITAQTLNVQTVSSSVIYSSGSNVFGNTLTNTQQFTGSVSITGSLTVNNSAAILTNQTSSMSVLSAQTASYVLQAVSASFATQAANATTASFITLAQTASYVLQAVSASFATQATNATTASYVLQAVSASFASTASSVNPLVQNVLITGSLNVSSSNQTQLQVGSNLLFVSSSGRVGIGTTTPSATLDVNGYQVFSSGGIYATTGATTALTSEINYFVHKRLSSSGTMGFKIFYGGDSSFWRYDGGTGDVEFGQTAVGAGALKLYTANTERIRIFYNGNIGINTATDAGFKLDVNGTTRLQNNTQITGSTSLTGSFTLIGNEIITGSSTATLGYTGSLFGTASWSSNALTASFVTTAQTASYVLQAVSASFASTASVAPLYVLTSATSSMLAPYVLTSQTASMSVLSSSFAATASSADNFTVRGTLTAQTIVAQTITSSTDFVTGSTRFGSLLSNTHQFTGSVSITGSLAVNGSNVILTNQTASMSVATASYVLNAVSSSFASTASFVQNAQTASYVLQAVSASFASTASSVNQLNQAVTISGSLTVSGSTNFVGSTGTTLFSANADTLIFTGSIFTSGSIVSTGSLNITNITSSLLGTASYATQALSASFATQAANATTASYVLQAVSASFASTASFVNPLIQNVQITGSLNVSAGITGSLFGTSSWAQNAVTASFVPGYVSGSGANGQIAYFGGTNFATSSATLAFTPTSQLLVNNSITAAAAIARGTNLTPTLTAAANNDVLVGLDINPTFTNGAFTGVSNFAARINGQLNVLGTKRIILNPSFSLAGNVRAGGVIATTGNFSIYSDSGVPGEGFDIDYWNGSIYMPGIRLNNVSSGFSSLQLMKDGGTVLIGTTTDAGFRLDVNGTTRLQSNTQITGSTALTGSLTLIGNQIITGSSTATLGYTGSLFGTASWATNAITAATASFANNLTVAGTLTAQTIVAQTITSSVSFITGSTQFGSLLTNTHQFTGSVLITGSLNVNGSDVILTNQTSSMSVATASFATTATTATTAATASFATNFTVASTLTLDQTLTDYFTVASSIVGANNLFTQATGSYTSAFFKYSATNGANTRAGEVVAAWNGTTVSFYDNSTVDIGTTTAVTASVSIVASSVQFNIQTNSSGWRLKSLATFM